MILKIMYQKANLSSFGSLYPKIHLFPPKNDFFQNNKPKKLQFLVLLFLLLPFQSFLIQVQGYQARIYTTECRYIGKVSISGHYL